MNRRNWSMLEPRRMVIEFKSADRKVVVGVKPLLQRMGKCDNGQCAATEKISSTVLNLSYPTSTPRANFAKISSVRFVIFVGLPSDAGRSPRAYCCFIINIKTLDLMLVIICLLLYASNNISAFCYLIKITSVALCELLIENAHCIIFFDMSLWLIQSEV